MPDSPVSIAYRSAMEVIAAAEPDVAGPSSVSWSPNGDN